MGQMEVDASPAAGDAVLEHLLRLEISSSVSAFRQMP
jgi:hypothetical protein